MIQGEGEEILDLQVANLPYKFLNWEIDSSIDYFFFRLRLNLNSSGTGAMPLRRSPVSETMGF